MLVIVAAALLAVACSGSKMENPRQVVIAMFGAMEKNDKAALTHVLDLAELAKTANEDYALSKREARVFTSPQQILEDLTDDGETKRRWFSLQRIVNTAEVQGDQASVEVTFVDKEESRGYLTKFGLHRIDGTWRIYSFRTVEGAS